MFFRRRVIVGEQEFDKYVVQCRDNSSLSFENAEIREIAPFLKEFIDKANEVDGNTDVTTLNVPFSSEEIEAYVDAERVMLQENIERAYSAFPVADFLGDEGRITGLGRCLLDAIVNETAFDIFDVFGMHPEYEYKIFASRPLTEDEWPKIRWLRSQTAELFRVVIMEGQLTASNGRLEDKTGAAFALLDGDLSHRTCADELVAPYQRIAARMREIVVSFDTLAAHINTTLPDSAVSLTFKTPMLLVQRFDPLLRRWSTNPNGVVEARTIPELNIILEGGLPYLGYYPDMEGIANMFESYFTRVQRVVFTSLDPEPLIMLIDAFSRIFRLGGPYQDSVSILTIRLTTLVRWNSEYHQLLKTFLEADNPLKKVVVNLEVGAGTSAIVLFSIRRMLPTGASRVRAQMEIGEPVQIASDPNARLIEEGEAVLPVTITIERLQQHKRRRVE
jgi:hypothetical protein